MPSVVLITREGLDAAVDVPKNIKLKKLPESSAIKAARIIYIFNHGKAVSPDFINNEIRNIAKRLEIGVAEAGMQFAHALEMIKLRAKVQAAASDYIIIQTRLSKNKLRSIRNPFDAALEAIYHATHVYKGDKNKLYKWIERLEFEKEMHK